MGAETEEAILSLPGDLPREVMNEFVRGWNREAVQAEIAQKEIAAAQPARTWMEGCGQVVLSITPFAYHYWGQLLGYECWRDKQFRHEFKRDNPAARVKSVSRKTMIVHPGNHSGFQASGPLILP